MSSRIGLRPILAISALVLVQAAAAQSKVAVVNLQEAVLGTAEIKQADAAMQTKYRPRLTEVEKLTAEGTALAQKLQADQGKLTPQAEADLQAQIVKLQRDVQRKNEDLQSDVERERNEILSRSSDKMGEVVKKLAVERALDMVVDASTTLYVKDALDITKDVIAAYDKAYPASAAAAPAAAAPAKPAGK